MGACMPTSNGCLYAPSNFDLSSSFLFSCPVLRASPPYHIPSVDARSHLTSTPCGIFASTKGKGQHESSHSWEWNPPGRKSSSCSYFPLHVIISRHFHTKIALVLHSWSRNESSEDSKCPSHHLPLGTWRQKHCPENVVYSSTQHKVGAQKIFVGGAPALFTTLIKSMHWDSERTNSQLMIKGLPFHSLTATKEYHMFI